MIWPRRACLPLVLLHVLAAFSFAAEIEIARNGEVRLSGAALTIVEEKVSAGFKARRWGMYSLFVEGGAADALKATVNGKPPKRPAEGPGALGTFYLEEAGPCAIEVGGATAKHVRALRLVPACEGSPVVQKKDEPIVLDARDSVVEGVMLRYEPNPRKLCLGFWGNPNDSPRWDFTVATPGSYEVFLTQGCGRGAGGSKAAIEVAGSKLEFTVEDTGGWQNWKKRSLGTVMFKNAGPQQMRVRVLKKARGIMDIRRIVLKLVK